MFEVNHNLATYKQPGNEVSCQYDLHGRCNAESTELSKVRARPEESF